MLVPMSTRSQRVQQVRAPISVNSMPQIEAVGQRVDLFDDFYHSVLESSWRRFLAGVCGVYLLANAIFAGLYMVEPGSITAASGGFRDAFFFSVQTMSTIGYGTMVPATRFADVLVTVEALFGILLVAVLTGITFARFARPTAKVLFSEKMVIARRDGVRYLMVRMANWRHNNVVEAHLRMFILHRSRTSEGEELRIPAELELVRSRTAVFWMSWTAVHRIDESSPFFSPESFARLRDHGTGIYLFFSGVDQTISTRIHASHTYSLDDIVDGARFVDILSRRADGVQVINYRNFHRTTTESWHVRPPEQAGPRVQDQ